MDFDRCDFLGGGFKHVIFSPLFGEMILFDENIFQMGWNHQLVFFAPPNFRQLLKMWKCVHESDMMDSGLKLHNMNNIVFILLYTLTSTYSI